jgi:competence protein ComEA
MGQGILPPLLAEAWSPCTNASGMSVAGTESAVLEERASLGDSVAAPADDINHATAQQLEAVPHIGPTKAAAIVNYRNTHPGGHTSIEDLDNVRGIGPATIEANRPFVTVTSL